MAISKPAPAFLVVFIVLFTLGATYFLWDHKQPSAVQQLQANDPSVSREGGLSLDTNQALSKTGEDEAIDSPSVADSADEPDACLRLVDLELSFDVDIELQRLRQTAQMGPWFNEYHGITLDALESLAEQHDTAAMVVLGARAELAASGNDPARAVDKLSGVAPALGIAMQPFGRELSAAQQEALEAAREWYERAALLGHLGALSHLGNIQVALGETPVTLGWISQEDFDALPEAARFPAEVINAYTSAISQIAPNAKTGLSGVLLSVAAPALRHKPYAKAVAVRYQAARQAAGLPPIEMTQGIPVDEIRKLVDKLCAEDRALFENG